MPDESKATPSSELAVRLVQPTKEMVEALGERCLVQMSFDPTSPTGAEKLITGSLDKLQSLREIANEVLEITDYFQHPAEKVGKDGSVTAFIRSVVFDKSGKAYDCGSDGVYKCLALVKAIKGNGPWNPPVKCKVLIRDLGDSKMFLLLRPLVESLFDNQTMPKK